MKYILICNSCGIRFERHDARYLCDTCRGKSNERRDEIERLLKEGGYKQKDIAKKFDVTPSYITKIKNEIGLRVHHKTLT